MDVSNSHHPQTGKIQGAPIEEFSENNILEQAVCQVAYMDPG
jgi:hypothetical protein